MTEANQPHLNTSAETKALLDRCDDAAEAFLVACVQFAKLMQFNVEAGQAGDVLGEKRDIVLEWLNHFQSRIDPVNGKIRNDAGLDWQGIMDRFR